MTTDARKTIEHYADRLAARSGLPEPARSEARGELVSHLYDAAAARARPATPAAGDAQAAIAELGGDDQADATFFAPRRTALPTAAFGRRAVAYAIDFLLFAVLVLPVAVVVMVFTFAWLLGPVAAALLGGFAFGFVEHRWGRTPGKAAMGLRVVGASGGPPTFKEAFLRNLTKAAPPVALADYVIGAWADRGQRLRLCDRVAGTRVVSAPVAVPPPPAVAA